MKVKMMRGKHETEKKKITFSRMGSERWSERDTQAQTERERERIKMAWTELEVDRQQWIAASWRGRGEGWNSQVRREGMDRERAVESMTEGGGGLHGGLAAARTHGRGGSRRRWEHYGWIMKRFHAVSQHHSPCMALTPKCQQAKRPSSSALPHVHTCTHVHTNTHTQASR